ncbi:fluoride efflux transporter FluC [Streptomyces noursei]|uniref:fluoride efflux transporter FluC n=1 Tax=Streptomyces noursei TaxID=1971 RepID=UPI00099E13A5
MEPSRHNAVQEPLDPDIGSLEAVRRSRHGRAAQQWPVLGAVSLGGALGAAARYGASLIWPSAGAFPWTTLVINVLGCAVIGVFMVVITDLWSAHRLVRPFFGTGVLGGFTTFSTYVVDIQLLIERGRAATALAYLTLTALSALAAVWASVTLTRRLIERSTR